MTPSNSPFHLRSTGLFRSIALRGILACVWLCLLSTSFAARTTHAQPGYWETQWRHAGDAAPPLAVSDWIRPPEEWLPDGSARSEVSVPAEGSGAETVHPGRRPDPPDGYPDSLLTDRTPQPFTVVAYWASWSPKSRLVLARQDSLLRALPDPEFAWVAVSPESRAAVATFVSEAGWRALPIALDATRTIYQRCVLEANDPRTFPDLPYVCVFGDPGRASGQQPTGSGSALLWRGPWVDPTPGVPPLGRFERVLHEIATGTFDLASERARHVGMERASRALFEFTESVRTDDARGVERSLAELEQQPESEPFELLDQMNGAAWNWIVREDRTPEHLALAGRMCRIALAHGGEENPFFLDTYAHFLEAEGRLTEAIEVERNAVAGVAGTPMAAELRGVLDEFLAAAGLPPEEGAGSDGVDPGGREDVAGAGTGPPEPGPANGPDAAAGPSEPSGGTGSDAGVPSWTGNMNGVWSTVAMSEMVVIHPPDSTWIAEIAAKRERFGWEAAGSLPGELSDEDRVRVLILFGTPEENPVTRSVLAHHGIRIEADGVSVGNARIEEESPVLLTAVPNPWNPLVPVLIYTAARTQDAHDLNRFFHGPTGFLVGHWKDGKPSTTLSLDYTPQSEPLQLAIGPDILSAEDAIADLRELSGELRDSYAGFADLEWSVLTAGSTWTERDRDFENRLRPRATIGWAEFYDLIREYLDPVQDTHFEMIGSARRNGVIETRRDNLVRSLDPYFTDLRLRKTADGSFRIHRWGDGSETDLLDRLDLIGGEMLDFEIATDPHGARVGTSILFPTLPHTPSLEDVVAEPREFLVGTFAHRDAPPDSIELRIRKVDEEIVTVALPVHRGRFGLPRRGGGWSISPEAEDDGAAGGNGRPPMVLNVRTMVESSLAGMPETADSLRHEPVLVLDLRANGGGGDRSAQRWCQRLTRQPFTWNASVAVFPDADDELRASFSSPGVTWRPIAGADTPEAPEPYPGRLLVLFDKGTASSGETFVQLAGQVPGAILIGENSAGCTDYGNVETHAPLSHSRIAFHFGRSRFVVDWIRPIEEGVGFFPDFWLDEADPRGLLSRIEVGGGHEEPARPWHSSINSAP